VYPLAVEVPEAPIVPEIAVPENCEDALPWVLRENDFLMILVGWPTLSDSSRTVGWGSANDVPVYHIVDGVVRSLVAVGPAPAALYAGETRRVNPRRWLLARGRSTFDEFGFHSVVDLTRLVDVGTLTNRYEIDSKPRITRLLLKENRAVV
jgi:hypothetical protein